MTAIICLAIVICLALLPLVLMGLGLVLNLIANIVMLILSPFMDL